MTKNEITNALMRPLLKDGNKYNSLIAKPTGQQKELENGDTFYSVAVMKVWVQTFYKQVEKLAAVLKAPTVRETCKRIHFFLYNNIQYKADNVLQNLRSPANSWAFRKTGIDCKSYSIFASSILTNLGIVHYIRQIKQARLNPTEFTHVYIVVPINQTTGNLEQGYYTIDGTLKGTKEPIYTIKKDVFMPQLPHMGLNGAKKPKRKPKGLTGSKKSMTAKKLCSSVIVKDGLKKDGTLKKGHRFLKGGKVVKVTPKTKKK